MKTKPSLSTLAKRFKCDRATVSRWKRDGAPIHSLPAMRNWLATRKNVPQATLKHLLSVPPKSKAAASSPASSPQTAGAPAALRRLEAAEVKAYTDLDRAIESGDALQVKTSRETWLRISDSLRRYDLLVEKSRRDSGEMISREEVEKVLFSAGCWLRQGLIQFGMSNAWVLAGMTDTGQIVNLLHAAGRDILTSSLAWAVQNSKLPVWAVRELKHAADIDLSATQDATFTLLRRAFAETFDELLRADAAAKQQVAQTAGATVPPEDKS